MKNKIRSILCIVLAITMVLALSACKSKDSDNLSDYTSDYTEEVGGISAVVVGSSVQDGQGDGFSLGSLSGLLGGSFSLGGFCGLFFSGSRTATGGQGQQHGNSQHQGEELLHGW